MNHMQSTWRKGHNSSRQHRINAESTSQQLPSVLVITAHSTHNLCLLYQRRHCFRGLPKQQRSSESAPKCCPVKECPKCPIRTTDNKLSRTQRPTSTHTHQSIGVGRSKHTAIMGTGWSSSTAREYRRLKNNNEREVGRGWSIVIVDPCACDRPSSFILPKAQNAIVSQAIRLNHYNYATEPSATKNSKLIYKKMHPNFPHTQFRHNTCQRDSIFLDNTTYTRHAYILTKSTHDSIKTTRTRSILVSAHQLSNPSSRTHSFQSCPWKLWRRQKTW